MRGQESRVFLVGKFIVLLNGLVLTLRVVVISTCRFGKPDSFVVKEIASGLKGAGNRASGMITSTYALPMTKRS